MKKQNKSGFKRVIGAFALAAVVLMIAALCLCGCEEADTGYYTFRNENLLEQHYEKHGIEMEFESAEEYEEAANKVISNPDALTKIEAEDGDSIYYVEKTNEFVVISTDGYIRTYFNPDAGMDYFNRQ